MSKEKAHRTMIGGQAVIEGVMMRGVQSSAVAVRAPDGKVRLKVWENSQISTRFPVLGLPILRGVVNFVEMLRIGYRTMSLSAEMAEGKEPASSEEVERTAPSFSLETESASSLSPAVQPVNTGEKEKSSDPSLYISLAIGLLIAIVLFLYLPSVLVKYTAGISQAGIFKTLIEGGIRIALFVGYLALISRMKEMRRLFAYHGAEHKTIYCYEHGEPLTPGNAQRFTRLHPRCGTSFLLIVLIIGIVASSFLPWDNLALRLVLKLVLLPLVVGVSYELIRFAGRHDGGIMRAVLAPGLWLQKLTTQEPDEEQLEVAICSLQAVLTDNPADDAW